jgi:hypothetical protein
MAVGTFAGARISPSGAACRRLAVLLLLFLAGCRSGPSRAVAVPAKHSVRSDSLLVLSDVKLPKDHPLIEDLVVLREQIVECLDLPPQRDQVVVYMFNTQLEYTQFLQATYPGLPNRRAYFVGTPRELAVYTFWGDRIQEDLRHEYTHGLLHASLNSVPLWLDEGLAEYFEVIGPRPGEVNREYAAALTTALANGWRPDLERLERIRKFEHMQRADYQEAWAWVHHMLHSSPETRSILLDYLHDLREEPDPVPLSERLKQDQPEYALRFLNYAATLNSTPMLAAEPRALPGRAELRPPGAVQ